MNAVRVLDNRAELEAFVDELMDSEITGGDGFPGATISIVKDGKPLLVKGYGIANTNTGTRVLGSRTLFRAGSISKLVTATAVMQLVETGKLSLDEDVNRYLTERPIPETFLQPVTLKNLLTHTGGFEENICGLLKRCPEQLIPLDKLISEHRPARVRPPTTDFTIGTGASYSSWGMCLAAQVVTTCSDAPSFDAHAKREIFDPLGMRHSTFEEPLPTGWDEHMARGHAYQNDAFEPQRFEYLHSIGPACSLTTTAADMARFMIAHLNGGLYKNERILRPETVDLMHSRILDPHPLVNGAGLGFYELRLNGRRLLTHRGFTLYFTSKLVLFPEENLGIFIAVNAGDAIGGIRWVVKDFMDEYYPAKRRPAQQPFAGTAASHAGRYFPNPRSYTKNDKVLQLFDPMYETKVTPVCSKELHMTEVAWKEWVEIGPGVFRQRDGQEIITFVDQHLVGAIMPFGPLHKLALHETPGFHKALWIAAAIAFASFLLAILWDYLIAVPSQSADNRLGLVRTLAVFAGFSGLAGWWAIWRSCSKGNHALVYGFPALFHAGLHLVLVMAVLTTGVLGFTVLAWLGDDWTLYQRLGSSVFALFALAFLWSMNHWNLLGYKFA